MKLLVLDGNSILNRAFYGIKLLTTKSGLYTNAIFGFMNILLKLMDSEKPDEVAIAFDLPVPTFRHKLYNGYKAKRKGMPEELAAQMPLLKELLANLGYAEVSVAGFEADDILGTLAHAAHQRGDEALLATGDRDSLQLVAPGVAVLLTTTQFGRGETTRMDEAAILEKYGVTPAQLIETKALMGDASDNIPGVPGVGEKTAFALIQQFGSMEGVYQNIDDPSIKPGVRQKLLDGRQSAEMSRELAIIHCDAPIATEPGSYAKQAGDPAAAAALLSQLEMFSVLERLGLQAAPAPEEAEADAPPLEEITPQPLPQGLAGMLFMAEGEPGTWLVVSAGGGAVYTTREDDPCLLALLRDEKAYKRVFDAKPLHKLCLNDGPCSTTAQAADAVAADEGAAAKAASKQPEGNENVQSSMFETARSTHETLPTDAAPGGYALAEHQANGARAQSINFDGKLAAYLLNPASSEYTVERLAAEYAVRPAFACPAYPAAPLLEPLLRKLSSDCEAAEMKKLLLEIEQPLAEVLASMELVGIALDAGGVRRFGDELQIELEKQLRSIYETVGYEFNVNSPKQLGEALFVKLGLPTRKKTKSGYSTDAETLESLRKYSPVIDSILLYRTYQKLNSTYVEGLLKVLGPDGRVRSTFNQTEARTGRISSDNPNLQNIPVRTTLGSRLRAYFVAPGGYQLADADYSQIELRILADISGDEAMRQAFRDGEDIHKATAARVNGLPLSMVTPQLRSSAKAVNFGIVYGIGAYSLSKDIGVSVKEADAFIKSYLDSFPGVRGYMEQTVAFGKTHGYVQTMYGRRRPLPELASSNRNVEALGERIALNTPIQGTAADIIKLAMIRVWQRLRDEKLRAKLILQVHDELIVETPQDEIEQVRAILKEEMEGAAQLSIPLQADVHCGQDWLASKG